MSSPKVRVSNHRDVNRLMNIRKRIKNIEDKFTQ